MDEHHAVVELEMLQHLHNVLPSKTSLPLSRVFSLGVSTLVAPPTSPPLPSPPKALPPALRYTDIAVNLTDPQFQGVYNNKNYHPSDFDDILSRCVAAGVHRLIINGTDVESSEEAMKMARSINASRRFPGLHVYSTVGVHPTSTGSLGSAPPEKVEAALLALAVDGMRDNTVVMIGECGMDMDRLHFSSEECQRKYFPLHLRLARTTSLPLFLHDRSTQGALLRLVEEHGGLPSSGGVVHSFTGTPQEVQHLITQTPLMVGLNGCGLKTSENCAAAALIPLDRLLLETDAPWCSIKPTSPAYKFTLGAGEGGGRVSVKREKFVPGCLVKDRNEPSLTPLVALAYAGLTGVPLEVVAAAAEENVRKLVGRFMAKEDA